jgi:protein-S-isoprenylcysteine O-methyltransferase Ste14
VVRWIYPAITSALWVAWFTYWMVSSRNTKEIARIESAGSRAKHLVPLIVGCVLFAGPPQLFPSWPWLSMHVLPWNAYTYWTGVALLASGFAFSIWAREHLGRNWSGIITVKEGHELIRTGPYRWIRHPIYTGLLVAFLGHAIAFNALRCFLGVLLCAVSLLRKMCIEERFMREQFGDEYSRYAAKTAALLPLVY